MLNNITNIQPFLFHQKMYTFKFLNSQFYSGKSKSVSLKWPSVATFFHLHSRSPAPLATRSESRRLRTRSSSSTCSTCLSRSTSTSRFSRTSSNPFSGFSTRMFLLGGPREKSLCQKHGVSFCSSMNP